MARKDPNPLAFFSLVPTNEQARDMLLLKENSHHVSTFIDPSTGEQEDGLGVGPHITSEARYTLATIGRKGNIVAPFNGTSRIQCSFEFHDKTGEIMLQDRSTAGTTQLLGETAVPFETSRPYRRVVVDNKVNLEFRFPGKKDEEGKITECLFRLVWHMEGGRMDQELRILREKTMHLKEDNPRLARTAENTPVPDSKSFRFSKRQIIGGGASGHVFLAADIDSGNRFMIKEIAMPAPQSQDYVNLKQEVEYMFKLGHDNLMNCIGYRQAGDKCHIIMEPRPGNVGDLVNKGHFEERPEEINALLHQMLKVLAFLASRNIVHRDVKPENILYDCLPGDTYRYELTDLGTASMAARAHTGAGSRIYKAPEQLMNMAAAQGPKMDVWSLFVTLAYVANARSFRKNVSPESFDSVREAVQKASQSAELYHFREMAEIDPQKRASAASMLDKLFKKK